MLLRKENFKIKYLSNHCQLINGLGITGNVQALAMWRHSVLRQPEPMLGKCTKADVKN
jgi:hypothetical protein